MRRATRLIVALCLAAAALPVAEAGAVDLELAGVEIDRTKIGSSPDWTVSETSAAWDTTSWHADYGWTLPRDVPAAGAPGTLTTTATDKSGGRIAAAMILSATNATLQGQTTVTARADKNTPGQETTSATSNFTLVPPATATGGPIVVSLGIQDGPTIKFTYRVKPPPTAPPTPATPAPATRGASGPTPPAFGRNGVITGLPSARRCVSRRSFTIRIRRRRGREYAFAQVLVNGRRVATRRGARVTAPIDLRGLPQGRYTVRIVVVTTAGESITGTRRYRTCAKKRRGGRPGPL